MAEILTDVPPVLYKYRSWDNHNHRKLFEERELYFSSIDQFNDPFDGTIPYRYDPAELTEDNIFKKYYSMAKNDHPDWREEQIVKLCYEYQQRGYFHDEGYLDKVEQDHLKKLNETFGIVCLCKKNNNFLLWSHYSNSHSGFCIGFDKMLLFEDAYHSQFSHMLYQEDLPVLSLFDNTFEHFAKLIGTKSKLWEYEEEYRLSQIYFARKKITLRPETIVEIIFGCKMTVEQKFEKLAFIEKMYPHARVFEASLSRKKFELVIVQIR